MTREASPVRLSELAALLGRDLVGEKDPFVSGVAPLEAATAGDLAFVRSGRWARKALESDAGAFIAPPDVDVGGRPVIVSPNPAFDFARAVAHILPSPRPEPGRHPSAQVAAGAQVDPSASLGANVFVGEGASVGARTVLHPNVSLYRDVVVGSECTLHAGVVIREGCVLGDRVQLQPGVVIGGDGFGYLAGRGGGAAEGPTAGSGGDRGRRGDRREHHGGSRHAVDETRVRRGAKIDNLVQIGHNCDIGEGAVIVAQTGLSGSTVVGRGAMIMAQAGSAGHLRVGDGAFVGARAGLHKDVRDGARVWGSPQLEERQWHKAMAALARLPSVLRRLRAVERAIGRAPDSEE